MPSNSDQSIPIDQPSDIFFQPVYIEICLIENIRFYPEEEKNDQDFVKQISKKFDLFVNDAFSVSHRHHASVIGFAKYLPAIAGDSLIEEIKNIDVFLNNPKNQI